MTNKDKCFIYINCCVFNGLEVSKIDVYACELPSRLLASVIEKAAHKKLKGLMLTEFGREVFNVSSDQSILLIDNIISESIDV